MMLFGGRNYAAILFLFVFFACGCMRFTERDYELQKKAYEKQQQAEEMRQKDTFRINW